MSLILFASKTQLTPDHQQFMADNGAMIYIRAIVHGGTVSEALDAAGDFMLEGEMVLNTVDPTKLL